MSRIQKKYSNPKEQAAFEHGVQAGFSDKQIADEYVDHLKGIITNYKRFDWLNKKKWPLVHHERKGWFVYNSETYGFHKTPQEAIDSVMKAEK